MEPLGWVALAVILATAALRLVRWLPLQVSALAIPVILHVTGVLPDPRDALGGFARPAVIAIAAIFVIGAGLREAGVTTVVARSLERAAGQSEWALVLLVMLATAGLSAFMSNAAVVAVFIPAAMTLCRRTSIAPSRLLMPMAFAAVLGGNLTEIGSAPNLLVADYLRDGEGLALDIGLLDFAVGGVPIVLAGTLYVMLHGRRLLPRRSRTARLREALVPEDVAKSYGLHVSLFRMKVLPESSVNGKTIANAGIRSRYGLHVLAVVRTRRMRRHFLDPRPDLALAAGDELYIEGDDEAAWRFADYETVQFGLAGAAEIERMLGRGMTLVEVALSPHSDVFGKTLSELSFRSRYGLHVMAIWRRGKVRRDDLASLRLELGDALLVSGRADKLQGLSADPNYIVLTDSSRGEDVRRAPRALLLLLLAIVPPLAGWTSLAMSSLAAAVLMVATGCLTIQQAERALDWKVLFLIIGTVPLGTALERTGAAEALAGPLAEATGGLGGLALLAIPFAVATLLAMVTTNAAAAVITAPIAAHLAAVGGLDPRAALLAVAYGSSCGYVLPFYQWNVLVMAPGGYRTRDYLRVGAGTTLVVAAAAVLALFLWKPA